MILGKISPAQSDILRRLRHRASLSRSELALACGLTPAAISVASKGLIDRGAVMENGRRRGAKGAPHVELSLNPAAGQSLGIHATRHAVAVSVLDFQGGLVAETARRGHFATFASVVLAVEACLAQLRAGGKVLPDPVIAATVALPTRFHSTSGALDLAQEVIDWLDSDPARQLGQLLHCPVSVENDANAAAMGEACLGNVDGYTTFAYLYLSEGVGSALVLGGQLFRGHGGNAGEIGALRPRGKSRPSFEDLAQFCAHHGPVPPDGRGQEVWAQYLHANPDVLARWLDRAGPEVAALGFALTAILAPQALYLGGSLPLIAREGLLPWLHFARHDLFEGGKVIQPEVRLSMSPAQDIVSYGAAAMAFDLAL